VNLRVANLRTVAQVAAWFWTLFAGIGGFVLLLHRGPLPLTNGWFAMFSGLAACPLLPWLVEKTSSVHVRWRVFLAVSATIMLAGRITVAVQGRPPPVDPPASGGFWGKVIE